jgi:hypothetical protein
MMKKSIALLLLVVTTATASELYFPNLSKNATGTTAAGSKNALDVNIASGSITLTEEATAADGGALPATVKVGAGYDGTNVQVLKTDSTGSLQVDVESSALPSGAATAAHQVTTHGYLDGVEGTLTTIDSSLTTIDGRVDGLEALITTTNSSVDGLEAAVDGLEGSVDGVEASLTSIDGKITAVNTGAVVVSSSALPTGAATEAKQDTGNTSLSSIDGKLAANYGAASGAVRVAAQVGNASGVADFDAGASSAQTVRVTQASRTVSDRARLSYAADTVTTAAYTELDSSLAAACNELEIFDSSGQTMVLATGAAASETDLLYILPGGNGRVPVRLAAATRLSVKGVSSSANTGELTVNCYQ